VREGRTGRLAAWLSGCRVLKDVESGNLFHDQMDRGPGEDWRPS
jgi:hypothetical protein